MHLPALLVLRAIAPIYYLTDCYNTNNSIQRAEIDFFKNAPTSLPSTSQPTRIAVLNPDVTLDYEDGTWEATKPFNLTVVVGVGAYTAKTG